MIKVALPNKGALFEPTLDLLNSCGYRVSKAGSNLSSIDPENNVIILPLFNPCAEQ